MKYLYLCIMTGSLFVIWISIASLFTKHMAAVIPLLIIFSIPFYLSLKKFLTYEYTISKLNFVLTTYIYTSFSGTLLGLFALLSNKAGSDRMLDIAYFSGFFLNFSISYLAKRRYRRVFELAQEQSKRLIGKNSQSDIDKTVIQIARSFQGNLTPIELTEYSDFCLEDSSKILEDMYDRGFLDIHVDDNGVIIYCLKSMQSNIKSLSD